MLTIARPYWSISIVSTTADVADTKHSTLPTPCFTLCKKASTNKALNTKKVMKDRKYFIPWPRGLRFGFCEQTYKLFFATIPCPSTPPKQHRNSPALLQCSQKLTQVVGGLFILNGIYMCLHGSPCCSTWEGRNSERRPAFPFSKGKKTKTRSPRI